VPTGFWVGHLSPCPVQLYDVWHLLRCPSAMQHPRSPIDRADSSALLLALVLVWYRRACGSENHRSGASPEHPLRSEARHAFCAVPTDFRERDVAMSVVGVFGHRFEVYTCSEVCFFPSLTLLQSLYPKLRPSGQRVLLVETRGLQTDRVPVRP
jgi:hypothetical protein